MKRTLLIICQLMFVVFALKAQSAEDKALMDKAKMKVQAYIKAETKYPESYVPMNWMDIEKAKQNPDRSLFDKTNDSLLNAKIDSFIVLEKAFPGYPKPTKLYSVLHVFSVKTSATEVVPKLYTFYFDEALNITDVDKRPPAEQIEKNKRIVAEADIKIRLIKEIAKMKSLKY